MPMAREKITSASAAAAWRKTRRAKTRAGSSLSARVSYMTEAVLCVIVGHPDRLHVGIADRRADELEAAAQQVLAQGVRFRGSGGDLASLENDRLAANEAPDIGVEAAEFLLHREKRLCVRDRAVDFQPVSDDP